MLFQQTYRPFSHLILYHIPQLAWLVVFLLYFQFWIFWPIWPLCWVLGHFNNLQTPQKSSITHRTVGSTPQCVTWPWPDNRKSGGRHCPSLLADFRWQEAAPQPPYVLRGEFRQRTSGRWLAAGRRGVIPVVAGNFRELFLGQLD